MTSALLNSLQARQRSLDALREAGELDHPVWHRARHFAKLIGSSWKLSDPGSGAQADKADDATMAVPFVVSTLSQDREGDILLPRGCEKHLPAGFHRNPVWLYGHARGTSTSGDGGGLPIGVARDAKGGIALQVTDDKILATCYFHGKTALSAQCYALAKMGVLSACSVGFVPIRGRRMKRDDSEVDLPRDVVLFGWPGYVFEEWELVEVSLVPVPANKEAIRLALEDGFEGKGLDPVLRRTLEPLAPPRRPWAHGMALGTGKTLASPGLEIQSLLLEKSAFATLADAALWVRSHSHDDSEVEELPDAWAFVQRQAPACTGADCRRDLAEGVSAVLCGRPSEEVPQSAPGKKDLSQSCGCKQNQERIPHMATKTQTPAKPAKKKDDGAATTANDSDNPGAGKEDVLPGVAYIRALKELMDEHGPRQEHPELQKMHGKMYDLAAACATKAYPDEDFGFEEPDDDTEEGEEEGKDVETEDEPDGDEEELDEEDEKNLAALNDTLYELTGKRVE